MRLIFATLNELVVSNGESKRLLLLPLRPSRQRIRDFIHEVFEYYDYENENPSLDSNTAHWILPYLIFDADSNNNYNSCEDLAKWFSEEYMPCIKPNVEKSKHYQSMADSRFSISQ